MLNLQVKPWQLWLLGALLFFSEYVVRTSSSVMLTELMQAFTINAAGIGILSACFYYPYTMMQIPVGMIVDRYPPGRVLAIMAAIFALGVILFAVTDNFTLAIMARVMMGLSAAFAFVGALKLVTVLFSSRMLGFLTGLTQALGMLGAATGAGPVALAVEHFGWRTTILQLGVFIAVIAILLFAFAWSITTTKVKKNRKIMDDIRNSILRHKQVLINALFAGLLYAPTLAFGEVWGVGYLESAQHYKHATAAVEVSWVFIGWGVGAPFLGMVSDKIAKRKPLMFFAIIASLVSLLLVLYVNLSIELMSVLLFIYGFANSGLVLSYAVAGELNPAGTTGLTMAFTNMASVLVGSACQPIIGYLLLHFAAKNSGFATLVYSGAAYRSAMLFLPVLLLLAFILCFFIKETNCRKVKL